MANKVTFDYSKTAEYISEGEITAMKRIAEDAKKLLLSREGEGNDFLGWIDLPVDYDKEEFARIQKAAAKIQSDSDVLLVIGIGGSYLGARAANEFLGHNFYNIIPKSMRKTPEIYYCGNNLSRPTAVRTEKRPPTSSGTINDSYPSSVARLLSAPLALSVVQ